MSLLTTQVIGQAGIQPAYQAATSGGDSYSPTSNTFLAAKNGSGAPITVTVVTTAAIFGQPISNIAISVPAGAEVFFGPFDPGEVAQPGTGLGDLTYSAVTSLTVAAMQCPSV